MGVGLAVLIRRPTLPCLTAFNITKTESLRYNSIQNFIVSWWNFFLGGLKMWHDPDVISFFDGRPRKWLDYDKWGATNEVWKNWMPFRIVMGDRRKLSLEASLVFVSVSRLRKPRGWISSKWARATARMRILAGGWNYNHGDLEVFFRPRGRAKAAGRVTRRGSVSERHPNTCDAWQFCQGRCISSGCYC